MNTKSEKPTDSPEYLRMSLAAALTLGFKKGLFYRNAKLYCINLLLTYASGCSARCAYCGLSKKRTGVYTEKSFIRVTWPTYRLDDIVARIAVRRDRVKRICISMITHKKAVEDTKSICRRLKANFDIPVSLLVSPTILNGNDLVDFKSAGADKIGVAVDLATEDLFDKFRGFGVGGPHKWEQYWRCFENALAVFGIGNAGTHLMVGMGETEKEMSRVIQRTRDLGGHTHLFSYFPEEGAVIDGCHPPSPPPIDQYRRIQLARYLIDESISRTDRFDFGPDDRIVGFGVSQAQLEGIIDSGEPFRTTGCTGNDGEVACNRPYGNSRPGPHIRNFPFSPIAGDIARIRKQLTGHP